MLKACLYRIYNVSEYNIIFKDACCPTYSKIYNQFIKVDYITRFVTINKQGKLSPQLVLPLELATPFVGLWHLASRDQYTSNSLNIISTIELDDIELVKGVAEQMLYYAMFDFNPSYEFNLINSTNEILIKSANEFI
jgi:hypothetical protein